MICHRILSGVIKPAEQIFLDVVIIIIIIRQTMIITSANDSYGLSVAELVLWFMSLFSVESLYCTRSVRETAEVMQHCVLETL